MHGMYLCLNDTTSYRALLRKMSYKDKASYASSPFMCKYVYKCTGCTRVWMKSDNKQAHQTKCHNHQSRGDTQTISAKTPLVTGLFCGKWLVKIRHPMHSRRPRVDICINARFVEWCSDDFCKKGTSYRTHLGEMTWKNKASYASSPSTCKYMYECTVCRVILRRYCWRGRVRDEMSSRRNLQRKWDSGESTWLVKFVIFGRLYI